MDYLVLMKRATETIFVEDVLYLLFLVVRLKHQMSVKRKILMTYYPLEVSFLVLIVLNVRCID